MSQEKCVVSDSACLIVLLEFYQFWSDEVMFKLFRGTFFSALCEHLSPLRSTALLETGVPTGHRPRR